MTRRRSRFSYAALFALPLALFASAGRAGTVTETYAFSLSNFTDVFGSTVSPLASITGSFTLTFDPGVSTSNQTVGLTVNYISDNFIDSAIGFDNFPAGGGFPDFIAFGGLANDADYIATGTNDFSLNIKFFDPANPMLALCSDGYGCGSAPDSAIASGYTLAGYANDAWLPLSGSVWAVPEPGSLALGVSALAGLFAVRRRRRVG